MSNRRNFLQKIGLGSAALFIGPKVFSSQTIKKAYNNSQNKPPIVISTWSHGLQANEEACNIL